MLVEVMAVPKTSDAALRAIQKYKSQLDEVRFSVQGGQKQAIKEAATAKGYNGIQPYIIALLEADSGLQLTKPKEDAKNAEA